MRAECRHTREYGKGQNEHKMENMAWLADGKMLLITGARISIACYVPKLVKLHYR